MLPKMCKCGFKMTMRLRTVIYKNKIEIDNVPIYTCESCSKSEVFQPIKLELTNLIITIGSNSAKKQYYFNETSELAFLFMVASQKEFKETSVEIILESRINELLDLLLLARSLQDELWVEDILKRLSQITLLSINTYDLS